MSQTGSYTGLTNCQANDRPLSATHVLRSAKDYLRAGLSPIPLRPFEKIPSIPEWQRFARQRPEEKDLEEWFSKPGVGIGVVLGDALAVIDFESEELYQRWASTPEAGKVVSSTWIVKTRRGIHVYLRLQEPTRPVKYSNLWELRTGRQQCVVPPTVIRVDGAEYCYRTVSGSPASIAVVDRRALQELLSVLPGWKSEPDHGEDIPEEAFRFLELNLKPYWVEGWRHQLALAISGWLAKEGWPVVWVERLVRRLAAAAGDPEIEDRLRAVQDTFERWRKGHEVAGLSLLEDLLPGSVLSAIRAVTNGVSIPDTIRKADLIRLAKEPEFQRKRRLAELVHHTLRADGYRLIREEEGEGVYLYDERKRRVMGIQKDDPDFAALLRNVFGLNPTEEEFSYVVADLQIKGRNDGQRVHVARWFHFDPEEGRLQISDHHGGIWLLEPGGDPVLVPNGDRGVFFLEDPAAAFDPDWKNPLDPFDLLTADLSFAVGEGAPLSPWLQRKVFRWFWLSVFFQDALPARPILSCYGPRGSGKTVALRRWAKLLGGKDAELFGGLRDEGERDFLISTTTRRVLLLDNVDDRVRWLAPRLEEIATGIAISLRMLYTTAREMVLRPRCMIGLTSTALPFWEGEHRREALIDRMLILRFAPLRERKTEGDLFRVVLQDRNRLWAGLISRLVSVLPLVKAVLDDPRVVNFRLADWANMTYAFARAEKDPEAKEDPEKEWEEILRGLNRSKQLAVLEDSPLPLLLDALAKEWPFEGWTTGELLRKFRAQASSLRITVPWKNPKALAKELRRLEGTLSEVWGIVAVRDGHTKQLRWKIPGKMMVSSSGDVRKGHGGKETPNGGMDPGMARRPAT